MVNSDNKNKKGNKNKQKYPKKRYEHTLFLKVR